MADEKKDKSHAVGAISSSAQIKPDRETVDRRPPKYPSRPSIAPTTKNRFPELAEAMKVAHRFLTEKGSPYRFCVYEIEDEVYIDLVILGKDGKIAQIKRKNITKDEFQKWLGMIQNGEGLFFEKTV